MKNYKIINYLIKYFNKRDYKLNDRSYSSYTKIAHHKTDNKDIICGSLNFLMKRCIKDIIKEGYSELCSPQGHFIDTFEVSYTVDNNESINMDNEYYVAFIMTCGDMEIRFTYSNELQYIENKKNVFYYFDTNNIVPFNLKFNRPEKKYFYHKNLESKSFADILIHQTEILRRYEK